MIFSTAEWLLIGTVATVGVLHTIVPDHWVPITLVARQRGWSRVQTGRAALLAGTGHVLTTLLIAAVVWIAGVVAAKAFGHIVDMLASAALVLFGGWIAISSLVSMRTGGGHGHSHGHSHSHDFPHLASGDNIHGPELSQIETPEGAIGLSIYETGLPPHFRLTGRQIERATAVTIRPDGSRQSFGFMKKGGYWQSTDDIPEPHGFRIELTLGHGDHEHIYSTEFAEHVHGNHEHRGHNHHDHDLDHGTKPKTGSRTALLLILGSSPMVEGIPAFFAAGKYGPSLIIVMSLVFAATTIATYVVLCVASLVGLQRVSLGPLERYGEVISGVFIALVGVVFWAFPVL
jgi:hypothetical protein